MRRRLRWLLWHPHQKLWNWSLVAVLRKLLGSRLSTIAIRSLITADSLLLIARVLARCVASRSFRSFPNRETPVLYIDCGTHKEGAEIRWVHRWFSDQYDLRILAFEASSEHFRDAQSALVDLNPSLCQVALVGPEQKEDTARLYKGGGDGRGDSLFAARGDDYEEVSARRLSGILSDAGYDLARIPVILRMNVEGAEQFVIADLIDVGLDRLVDGYYGMWDDLSKIDPAGDLQFRRKLRDRGISPLTFNQRDLGHRLRRVAIRLDIKRAIRSGAARKRA